MYTKAENKVSVNQNIFVEIIKYPLIRKSMQSTINDTQFQAYVENWVMVAEILLDAALDSVNDHITSYNVRKDLPVV